MARIYHSREIGMANIRAALVTHPGEADLCVYRVSSRGLAHGDAYWFICRDQGEATACVHFTSIGMAQVKICFVSARGEAGWRTRHRLKGRFG